MSYAITCLGNQSGPTDCYGRQYESSDDGTGLLYDKCCTANTWDEATWRGIKGDASWAAVLENLVRQTLVYLTEANIKQFAYDNSFNGEKTVSSALIAKCVNAAKNFVDTYPPERWVEGSLGGDSCENNGPVWTPGLHPNPAIQSAALKRLLGANYSEAKSTSWYQSSQAVINSIPHSYGMGFWIQPVQPITSFFTIQGNTVVATPWLQSFLNAFNPKVQASMSAAKLVNLSTPRSGVITQPMTSKAVVQQQPAASSNMTMYIVLGVGVLAVAGVVYYKFA